jgi:two-component system response regulator HydG
VGGRVGEVASAPVVVRAGAPIGPLREALEGPERAIIVRALAAFGGNRQETARALDINRTTLYKKMKQYGLLDEEGDRYGKVGTATGNHCQS